MDLSTVPNFLSNEAGKNVPELANPSPDLLQKAMQLYTAYGGRLPSPPPPEPLQPSKQLEVFIHEFSVGINEFLHRSDDIHATQAFATSSWDGLQAEANKAWAAYNNHQKRKRNWRRPFEVLDNVAEKVMTTCCIEFLLELMPDGEYTSLLSGGLTLAYHTALRKEKVRENILELFDSLSERAKQTKAKIKLYSRDPILHAKSEELYMAVLDCVRHSTAWLDSSSSYESFKAFFQQSKYGARLEDAKANLDKKAKEFEETVNMCFRREVHDIHNNVEWLKAPILATFSLLAGFTKDFPGNLRKEEVEANTSAALVTGLFMQAHRSQPPLMMNFMQTPTMITRQPHQVMQNIISSRQVCQYLAVEYTSAALRTRQDVTTVALSELDANITTAMGYIPPPSQREKMGVLTLSPQFKMWLHTIDSAFLVLHESGTAHQNVLSTLSHLCGLMARTMRAPAMWMLVFFCGLHTADGAMLQGGRGLMRAITLQLLSTIQDATFQTPANPSTGAQQLVSGDLETICSIFAMALGQLPAGMVFVLIDGAHWNGTEARSAEMRAVVRFLHKMVGQLRAARRGLALKVLVTNPSARQRFEWNVAGEDLYMERHVLARGHQGAEGEAISNTTARHLPNS
ncbi:hypothetical protein TCE0_042f14584 [Talaromyces pinophilus]|uniref:DUF7708 domain-containing protein n=1 Tax=Talaromyces pinophilus TaxID=128442 RepID=A0A6V8HP20_TALPI|nr:hypothetical protein TCE0_042f14584 [Talaromyces pinophilus]